MKTLVVSLHDVHQGSLEAIQEQVAFFNQLGVHRFSHLVIPNYHHEGELTQSTIQWLSERQAQGDDLVLHGHYHDRQDRETGSWFYTKFYTANEAEFLDLPDEVAEQRLKQGMQLWQSLGWHCRGFIAPAWLMPQSLDVQLAKLGLMYTTRLKTFHHLQQQKQTDSQSLCYSTRAKWRVQASLLWNAYLFNQLKGKSLVRLSMHPNDLRFPKVKQQIARHVSLLLENGYQPLSYAEYASL